MKKSSLFIAIILACMIMLPAGAFALPISGSGAWGSFTGSLEYRYEASNSAYLTISLTNTSPAANGGYLVAFAFNNPGNNIVSIDLEATNTNFSAALDNNSINAQPYGLFDILASTSGSFEGGGRPQYGIAAGDSAIFAFYLLGYNLDTLNDLSFVNELSTTGAAFFVARFTGFENEMSDKVPAGGASVPEPGTMLLLGLGLVGLGITTRRKSRL